MNFKKLEAFISVLEKRSFSEAAAALKSSQPAISIKIKSLEEELGIELLDRGRSGVHPTRAGILVYQTAKEIMGRWGQLEDDLLGFQDTLTGTLTIGASTIPGTYLIPGWIKKFRTLYPKVDVKIEINDSRKVLNNLIDHQIDVGIVGLHQQSAKMITKVVASDSLVLIVPVEHEIPQSSHLDFNLLKKYDLVLREEGSGTRKEMEEYLEINGSSLADFNSSISIGSSEAVISAVEAGLGISFISKLAAVPAVKANRVKMIETLKPYQRNFYFSTLSESENRPIIREFTNFLAKGQMSI
ncbi:selenium metabolism-associated LysR family transcriptional regulator [Neobacillus sp. PS3-12]|uniref:selenium metabolism-associated LysR family transcriptional regulator n=1 Tax=Neobacillus sp. PS3-12 TaxID=3070677 RepID=UPI0027E1825E|nr:selenium metabolism-associated LysR family transcriptional regulator [Neobacillus sp. PS3-12]WML52623.1 selenium metabolism-associated LysR family transcriptional regulator [Neobacillus sp. PS3-12]